MVLALLAKQSQATFSIFFSHLYRLFICALLLKAQIVVFNHFYNHNCLCIKYDQREKIMNLTQKEFLRALEYLQSSRQNRQVLDWADQELASVSIGRLVQLLSGEVNEYLEACGASKLGDPIDPRDLRDHGMSHHDALDDQVTEWIDVLIYMLIIFKETKLYPDLGLLTTAQAVRSDPTKLITLMIERLTEMESGVTQAKLDQIMEVWQMMAAYLPAELNVTLAVLIKLLTNGWNRPEKYYHNYDETGKKLTEAEMHERYLHSERCLRLIRDYFAKVCGKKVRLYWWMHRPFAKYILEFRNSRESIAALQMALANSASLYQDMLFEAASDSGFSQEERILLAMAAGGYALSAVPEPRPLTQLLN